MRLRTAGLRAAQFAAVCLMLGSARDAGAYTIETAGTPPCHEDISLNGWRQAQAAFPEQTRPLEPRGDDEALIKDVPFSVPKSQRSIGPVTLLLGVRDNDIKEHGPTDLKNLTPLASDPLGQSEHCLRAAEDDEPDGSRRAVESCRQFVRESLYGALDGLDDQGRPDSRKREELKVSLAIREEIDVDVPLFFLRAGRALHAIQDSFTHTFRNPEQPGKIRVVLNFIDYTAGTLDAAVDGPPHASELDKCDDPDELRAERHALAKEASGVALMALLDPALDRQGKEKAIEDMLDTYITFDEEFACNIDNNWCDAPERGYDSPTLRCSFSGGVPRSGMSGVVGTALLAGLLLRRRQLVGLLLKQRRLSALLAAGTAFCVAAPAQADESSGPSYGPVAVMTGDAQPAVPGKIERGGAFFGRLAIGGSYDNTALSAGAGVRYQLNTGWMLGFDGEWNPYVALTPGEIRSGSVNAYLSLIKRFQLKWETVNVRSTVSAGASMLLFDLVGADKHSVGPYFGISFLGVEWKAARGVYVTIDPTYIAIPIPSVTGVPFMYAQYRFLLGLEFGG